MTIFTSHTDGMLYQAPSTVTSLGGVFLHKQHPTMPQLSVNPTRHIHCQTGFYYLLSLCIYTALVFPPSSRTHTLGLPGLSWGPNVFQQALLSHPGKNGLSFQACLCQTLSTLVTESSYILASKADLGIPFCKLPKLKDSSSCISSII